MFQDTSTYTCHVHGAFASVAKSLTIYVRRPSLHPLTCLPDSTPGNVGSQIPWPETLSDVTAIQDVYYGTLGNSALNRQVKQRPGCLVTRRCSLVGTRAEWRLPDFSKCATPAMLKIRNNVSAPAHSSFLSLSLYISTNILVALTFPSVSLPLLVHVRTFQITLLLTQLLSFDQTLFQLCRNSFSSSSL
jgi:hypothetical protein